MNTGLKQDRRAKLRAAAARVKASLKPEFQPLGADEIMGFLRGDEHVSAPKRVTQPNHQGRMISPPLFTACVPVLLRYLQTLSRLLDAVEFHAALPAADLLAARLADDMMPLARQVETACHLALRTALPLAGRPVPVFEPSVNSRPCNSPAARMNAHFLA